MGSIRGISRGRLGGVGVVVHEMGGGEVPVLLCHATGFCGRVWEPVAERLGGLGFRCWALDFRGHGDSRAGDGEDFAWSGMADDVLAAVDGLSPRPRLAAGHSMGAAAIVLAELARPGTFDRAWLYEPIIISPEARLSGAPEGGAGEGDGGMERGGPNGLAESARRRREVFASKAAALERYGGRPPLNVFHPDALAAYVEHGFEDLEDGTVRLKCRKETEAAVFENSFHDGFAQLGKVNTEIVVARGGDGQTPALAAPAVAEQLPHSSFVHYDELTHFGPMEDPGLIASAIAAALLG